MNPILDKACRWFGAYHCADATLGQIMAMLFTAAVAAILVFWWLKQV